MITPTTSSTTFKVQKMLFSPSWTNTCDIWTNTFQYLDKYLQISQYALTHDKRSRSLTEEQKTKFGKIHFANWTNIF